MHLAAQAGVRHSLVDPYAYIHANLPQPVDKELVPPVVGSAFREIAPNYLVRDLFAARREEIRREASAAIVRTLAPDAIVVREVMLRDIQLPTEYAKGLEGVLLKEQENDRLSVEVEVKAKQVRTAELEAQAERARQVTQAEGEAQVTVLRFQAHELMRRSITRTIVKLLVYLFERSQRSTGERM